jgi:hypothetical protein
MPLSLFVDEILREAIPGGIERALDGFGGPNGDLVFARASAENKR